jgi:hypothetical protein
MNDDDPQIVSHFLPCTTSIHLAHNVFLATPVHLLVRLCAGASTPVT